MGYFHTKTAIYSSRQSTNENKRHYPASLSSHFLHFQLTIRIPVLHLCQHIIHNRYCKQFLAKQFQQKHLWSFQPCFCTCASKIAPCFSAHALETLPTSSEKMFQHYRMHDFFLCTHVLSVSILCLFILMSSHSSCLFFCKGDD